MTLEANLTDTTFFLHFLSGLTTPRTNTSTSAYAYTNPSRSPSQGSSKPRLHRDHVDDTDVQASSSRRIYYPFDAAGKLPLCRFSNTFWAPPVRPNSHDPTIPLLASATPGNPDHASSQSLGQLSTLRNSSNVCANARPAAAAAASTPTATAAAAAAATPTTATPVAAKAVQPPRAPYHIHAPRQRDEQYPGRNREPVPSRR